MLPFARLQAAGIGVGGTGVYCDEVKGVRTVHMILLLIAWLIPVPALAQNTCYTGPQGTTICSGTGGVIHGNTNSVGNSVYRDSRGKQLDFQTDQFGNASVQPSAGESIDWSQPVLGERKYPDLDSSPPTPTPLQPPATLPATTDPFQQNHQHK
jgi:hypothetical protein